MADLFRLSASEAAAQIREGNFTSESLVRSCLERIDAREAQVKAWAHLDRDFALRQARECDRGASRGPLHGVPFAAKDIMDTADLPTEYGSPIYKGNRPKADAACVALSRAAGGVLLGKTATTEFASRSPLGDQDIHGISGRSPFWMMWSKPMSLSKPFVRFRTTDPSLLDTRITSISPSLRLNVMTASRSPDGDAVIEMASMYFVFSLFGARSRP